MGSAHPIGLMIMEQKSLFLERLWVKMKELSVKRILLGILLAAIGIFLFAYISSSHVTVSVEHPHAEINNYTKLVHKYSLITMYGEKFILEAHFEGGLKDKIRMWFTKDVYPPRLHLYIIGDAKYTGIKKVLLPTRSIYQFVGGSSATYLGNIDKFDTDIYLDGGRIVFDGKMLDQNDIGAKMPSRKDVVQLEIIATGDFPLEFYSDNFSAMSAWLTKRNYFELSDEFNSFEQEWDRVNNRE